MKNLKKIAALVLTAALVVALAACGSSKGSAKSANLKILDTEYVTEDYAIAVSKDKQELLDKINKALAELKEDGTVDKIVGKYINDGTTSSTTIDIDDSNVSEDAPTLVMGTNASFPPYEFVDDDGNFGGIDVELAKAIAAKLGMKLEIKDMDFDSLIPAVKANSIDVILAGMTVNEERKQSVNFSDSYATGIQVVIVKEGSDIKTVDDLKGKKIGVQAGTTGDTYCTDDFGAENVKQYQNGSLAVAALKNGQVDCVVIDNEPAKNYVAANSK